MQPAKKNYLPNVLEFALIILLGEAVVILEAYEWMNPDPLYALIVTICWAKTTWFIYETSTQLVNATKMNMPYHQFLMIAGVNMVQIILSFAIDYFTLVRVDINAFNGFNAEFNDLEMLFECFYFSCLNFSFFGYGDITPNNIPAKLVTLTEILLAFMTVIFILADFISLKESILSHENTKKNQENNVENP
jgi:Ion channel